MVDIIAIVRHNLRRLLSKPRFYAAMLISLCGIYLCFRNVPPYLSQANLDIQAGELFILFLSSRGSQWYLTLAFLLLAGDVPFFHEGMDILLLRTSRKRWLIAQVLFMFLLTLLWLFFIELCLILFTLPHVSFANTWSYYLLTISRLVYPGQEMGLEIDMTVSYNLIASGTPTRAFFLQLLYGILLFNYIGLCSLLLNLITKRSYASLLVTVFLVLRTAIGNIVFFSAAKYISPMDLIDIATGSGKLLYIVSFFMIQILLLYFLCNRIFRHHDLCKTNG